MSTFLGQIVDGRYRIAEVLSEGGMGRVYVAEHLKLHKRVAFKVVRADLLGDGELAIRFAREAMVTSALDHPNVVSAIDYGSLPDRGAYLVMQLVQGPSLAELLDRHGNLHWSRAADIGAQIADALSAAHKHGIIHRDLKPENIVIQTREDGGDLVKILDFGVARVARESLPARPRSGSGQGGARGLTQTGMLIGTPGYMAPEQTRGELASYASDLYALGIVLWELCVGQHPFPGEDVDEVFRLQRESPPAGLREATSDLTIPEELDVLVARLCAVDPQRRPQEVGSVRDVLRRLATRAVANAPPSRSEVELVGAPAPAPRATQRGERPATAGGKRGVLVGAALAVLATLALVTLGQLEIRPQGRLDATMRKIAPGGAVVAVPEQPPAPAPPSAVAPAESPPLVAALAESPPAARAEAPAASPRALAVADADGGSEPVSGGEAVAGYVEVLSSGRLHASRLAAASSVLALPADAGELPPFVRGLSRLQLAEGCEALERELGALYALRDPATLEPLSRIAAQPTAVCGPAQGEECATCLREHIGRALPLLRITAGAQAGP